MSATGSSVTVCWFGSSAVSPTQSGNELRCVVLANVIRAYGGAPSAAARCRLNVCPPLSRVKTMRSPVGDHAGSASKIGASVMLSAALPSTFMVQTDVVSPRPLTNRIFSPSGDQSGSASRLGLSEVKFPSSPPSSEFIVKMSLSPSRSESKASFVPSGLQVGPRSFPSRVRQVGLGAAVDIHDPDVVGPLAIAVKCDLGAVRRECRRSVPAVTARRQRVLLGAVAVHQPDPAASVPRDQAAVGRQRRARVGDRRTVRQPA